MELMISEAQHSHAQAREILVAYRVVTLLAQVRTAVDLHQKVCAVRAEWKADPNP